MKVPKGVEDGGQIRLKGQGQPGIADGPPGDIIVEMKVQPHRFFSRKGNDIYCHVDVSFSRAALGTKVRVKTIEGKKIELKIPAGTQRGTTFRLAGLGIERNGKKGDQYITIQVQIPEHLTDEEKELMNQYTQKSDLNP